MSSRLSCGELVTREKVAHASDARSHSRGWGRVMYGDAVPAPRRSDALRQLHDHVAELMACRACPDMVGPVVTGLPVVSPVMLIGQAPGDKEGPAGKPFAWTAGKTMFGWFGGLGVTEADFRRLVYMAAVCRCFP